MSLRFFCIVLSMQGSNYPRLFWGAFTPNTVIYCLLLVLFLLSYSKSYVLKVNCGTYNFSSNMKRHLHICVKYNYNKFIFLQKICQVACGSVHVVALSGDGLLQAWGNVSRPLSNSTFLSVWANYVFFLRIFLLFSSLFSFSFFWEYKVYTNMSCILREDFILASELS